MTVYLVTNKITGKQYVGQTTQQLRLRWWQHCNPKKPYCILLHRAIQKYGKDNFSIEVIATATNIEELNSLEALYIQKYSTLKPNGYNLMGGGNNRKHHEETKAKMRASRLGKPQPWNRKPRGPMPPEFGAKVSAAKKGKSNGLLGTKRSYTPHLSRRKKVTAVGFRTFDSVTIAGAYLGITHANISACLKGRRKKAGGYEWVYNNE